jgi:hypothetical protein
MGDTTFRLSRIFAEGWNAAQALPANECDGLERRDVAALSPYATEPERSRWSEGFAKALWS